MNDILVPDWIKSREAASIATATNLALRAQEQRSAELLIQERAAGFWAALLETIAVNLEALPRIGLWGNLQPLSHPEKGEQIYRVQVAQRSPVIRDLYLDIQFSLPLGSNIKCRTARSEVWELVLAVSTIGNDIGALPQDGIIPMSAKDAGERIVRELVDRLS